VLKEQGGLDDALKPNKTRSQYSGALRTPSRRPSLARWPDGELRHGRRYPGNQGKLTEAIESYRETLAISERLASSDPGNTRWQNLRPWRTRRSAAC